MCRNNKDEVTFIQLERREANTKVGIDNVITTEFQGLIKATVQTICSILL